MPDREAKKKTEIKKSAVSAPVEIGKPKEGSEKDIRWYVIHTYSGYENKVKDTLTRKVHSMGMDDTIIQILLPMHDEEEVKDGEKKVVSRKVFPGYLLIQMEVNDRSWYVVRNTPGVTGFVGTTTKPIPLSDEEAKRIIEGKDKKQTARQMLKWAIPLRSPADRLPTAAPWCWTCLMTEARLKLISVISAQRQL